MEQQTKWIVLQGWLQKYTLGHWLGIDPLSTSLISPEQEKILNEFGGGKKLPRDQIISYIHHPYNCNSPSHGDDFYFVRIMNPTKPTFGS